MDFSQKTQQTLESQSAATKLRVAIALTRQVQNAYPNDEYLAFLLKLARKQMNEALGIAEALSL